MVGTIDIPVGVKHYRQRVTGNNIVLIHTILIL